MFFNSIEFAIFLPIVFCLYWFCFNKNIRLQNLLILAASYLFYGWWDWRFLSLIIFSSIVDFLIGIQLAKSKIVWQKKLLLATSITVNLGFLGFFKYFNFFADSFAQAFTILGNATVDPILLKVVLPVGISFYTFQTLSYSIDVYKGKLKPCKDIIVFLTFVSFFPQLVAGPIERATNLLPQFYRRRTFSYSQSVDGMRQILWGLFKKMVIADNCAFYANDIFNNYSNYSGSTLLLGAFLFTLQIYGDFSGYSDVAIGTSRLFGFNLMQNFAFPYFSRDVAEFWRRWHISLSTWFRDYLYIPLGGSKGSTWKKVRNTFIIFVVSGFWHGANWTFIVWGALNAIYFLPLLLLNRNRSNLKVVAEGKYLPSLKEIFSMTVTFILTGFAWIFFRAETVTQAVSYINGIFSLSLFSVPEIFPLKIIALIAIFMLIEWLGREQQYAIEKIHTVFPKAIRWATYYLIIVSIFSFTGQEQEFIYFQF